MDEIRMVDDIRVVWLLWQLHKESLSDRIVNGKLSSPAGQIGRALQYHGTWEGKHHKLMHWLAEQRFSELHHCSCDKRILFM